MIGAIRSIHARPTFGRKRGLAGIGTKWLEVKRLNTLQQVSKLTSTNGPIKMQEYPSQSAKRLQEGIEGYVHGVGGKYCCISPLVSGRCGKYNMYYRPTIASKFTLI